MTGRRLCVVLVLLLPSFTAELLTGATRLPGFINPVSLGVLVGLYGFGALLVREARVWWGVGYGGVLLLGLAYGVVEEGVAVKSFFDPHWRDLGIFGVYGRWLGVNWVWSLYLTLFHGIWSILAPIVLVETLCPSIMDKPWLGKRGLSLSLIVFIIDVLLINLLLTRYQPSIFHYLGCFIVIAILVYMAGKTRVYTRQVSISHRRYGLYWLLWGVFFFISFYAVSAIIPLPIIPILLGIILGFIAYNLVKQLDTYKEKPLHRYWLYTGVVAVLIIIDLLQALQPDIERLAVTVIATTMLLIFRSQLTVRST